MFGIMGLLQSACAVILVLLAIGIYRQKPDIRSIESDLARQPLVTHAMLAFLLTMILAGSLGLSQGVFAMPAEFIDTFGLIIHEGGHFLTSWAGRFVHLLGGTLFEIGVPAVLTIWFLRANCKRLGAMTLTWMSVALFSAATYSGDAQNLELNLLGSSDLIEHKMLGHDWYNMLTMLGMLEAAPLVSDVFWSMALVAGLAAIAVLGWAVLAEHRAKAVFDQKLS
ncbi:MAG: hypothetical protein AAF331_12895 [Pseudomonadota bacterium]